MKTKAFLIKAGLLFISFNTNAQHSGNIAYGQNNSIERNRNLDKLYLTDSTFIIEANILANVIADSYVITFGVSDESTTVKECNEKIEKRIQSFVAELNKQGYSENDIFIDMTTQNKVFDYKITGNIAEQYLKGFEIKKNVIIKLKSIKELDKLLISASNYQIYDLVKVDYIVTDIAKVYNQLFQSATEIINQKKTMYISVTNSKLSPTSQIYGEQFYSYYPNQLYKSYVAYEGSEVYNSYNSYTKKDLKKSTTFYYDKVSYSSFDKVINPSITEPAIEFVLTLQIKFQNEKNKK